MQLPRMRTSTVSSCFPQVKRRSDTSLPSTFRRTCSTRGSTCSTDASAAPRNELSTARTELVLPGASIGPGELQILTCVCTSHGSGRRCRPGGSNAGGKGCLCDYHGRCCGRDIHCGSRTRGVRLGARAYNDGTAKARPRNEHPVPAVRILQ